MKKIVALALCFVMLVGLLSGCQKPMDALTLAQKMDEAMAAQAAMSAKIAMEMDMTMGITGMSMDMGMDLDVETKSAMNGGKTYMKGTMTMEILGEKETTDMESYMSVTDGVGTTYSRSDADGTWVKQEQPIPEDLQTTALKLAELPAENLVLAEEKELVGEKECYVLTVTYTGADAKAYIDTMLATAAAEMGEEVKDLLESMDLSAVTATLVYHVDPDTFLPVQNTGEVQGLGEAMEQVMDTVMGELLAALGGEEMEFTVEVPPVKFHMTEIVYGDVEIPDAPQEAIDNAVDADELAAIMDGMGSDYGGLQEDGSYLMLLDNATVRVVLPEDYQDVYADYYYMEATNEADTTYLTIDMLEGSTAAEFEAEVLSMMDDAVASGEAESYSEVQDMGGFRAASIRYNDSGLIVDVWYAWQEVDGSLMIWDVETVDESFDMAGLISGVEIVTE